MEFLSKLRQIINRGMSRSIVLTGNVYDLFYDASKDVYVPLIQFLQTQIKPEGTTRQKGITKVIYELNSEIVIQGDKNELALCWKESKIGRELDEILKDTNRNPTFTFEVMRQLTEVMRMRSNKTKNNLLMIVESMDVLIPDDQINRMDIQDRRRMMILYDWLSDPNFMESANTVLMLAESRSAIHHRISRLPQVLSVDIPLPSLDDRKLFIDWMASKRNIDCKPAEIAKHTTGLSLHAVRQLMLSEDFSLENIASKVEEYMISQLGDGVVEFKRPKHKLVDCIGNNKVKKFSQNVLIPGFQNGTISGAAVGGPIGGGKTFVCEAIAAELGIPVIILKNIRSKWYGETDSIFERLRRLLESFNQIVIFVDEADTQFGNVSADAHETERRLTGKIQAMMSDTALKGKVIWFLMTARIHLLSPDIRRPGRMDLIIPILDPEEDDRKEFIKWVMESLEKNIPGAIKNRELELKIDTLTKGYSAASFSLLRNLTKDVTSIEELVSVANDILSPDIERERLYQTLQAKLNCTRASLLFDHSGQEHVNKTRKQWKDQILELERLYGCR